MPVRPQEVTNGPDGAVGEGLEVQVGVQQVGQGQQERRQPDEHDDGEHYPARQTRT